MKDKDDKMIYLSVSEFENIVINIVETAIERKFSSLDFSAEEEKFLRVSDVAELMQLTEQTIYKYKRLGIIPYKKIGKNLFFSKKEIVKFKQEKMNEYNKQWN